MLLRKKWSVLLLVVPRLGRIWSSMLSLITGLNRLLSLIWLKGREDLGLYLQGGMEGGGGLRLLVRGEGLVLG